MYLLIISLSLVLILLILAPISSSTILSIDYCKYPCKELKNAENSACMNAPCDPKPPCELMKQSDRVTFRNYITDLHNMYRSQIATGQHGYGDDIAPTAANMRVLNYDLRLEETARCSGPMLKCSMQHDTCARTDKFSTAGQNLALKGASSMMSDYLSLVNFSVQIWFSEIKDRKKSEGLKFSAGTGHYTQLVWAKTTHIGCAMFQKLNKKNSYTFLTICNYGPAGNMIGEDMYKKGNYCSACPEDAQCNTNYMKGLCGERVLVKQSDLERESVAQSKKNKSNMLVASAVLVLLLINLIMLILL